MRFLFFPKFEFYSLIRIKWCVIHVSAFIICHRILSFCREIPLLIWCLGSEFSGFDPILTDISNFWGLPVEYPRMQAYDEITKSLASPNHKIFTIISKSHPYKIFLCRKIRILSFQNYFFHRFPKREKVYFRFFAPFCIHTLYFHGVFGINLCSHGPKPVFKHVGLFIWGYFSCQQPRRCIHNVFN